MLCFFFLNSAENNIFLAIKVKSKLRTLYAVLQVIIDFVLFCFVFVAMTVVLWWYFILIKCFFRVFSNRQVLFCKQEKKIDVYIINDYITQTA